MEYNYTEKRIRLVMSILPYLEQYGFCEKAVLCAAQDVNMSYDEGLLLLPDMQQDICHIWAKELDIELKMYANSLPIDGRIRDKIGNLVKYRIKQLSPYKSVIRHIYGRSISSVFGVQAGQGVWNTADSIWQSIGDTSRNNSFAYYSKRTTLSLVIVSVVGFWLQDNPNNTSDTADIANPAENNYTINNNNGNKSGENSTATDAFIDRQIDRVIATGKALSSASIKSKFKKIQAYASFINHPLKMRDEE